MEKPWYRLVGVGIPIAWIWFALLGVRWDILFSLFITIALTIVLGSVYSILDPGSVKGNSHHK